MPGLHNYEIVLPSFDGGTDETDDQILWVLAPDLRAVLAIVAPLGCKADTMDVVPTSDVDFTLPAQSNELVARINELKAKHHG